MEGFEVHFQCWLVVDVDFGSVFFVDLLPPAPIEATSTLPVPLETFIEHTNDELVIRAKGYDLFTPFITPLADDACEGR